MRLGLNRMFYHKNEYQNKYVIENQNTIKKDYSKVA
jgi:hypothetical protein